MQYNPIARLFLLFGLRCGEATTIRSTTLECAIQNTAFMVSVNGCENDTRSVLTAWSTYTNEAHLRTYCIECIIAETVHAFAVFTAHNVRMDDVRLCRQRGDNTHMPDDALDATGRRRPATFGWAKW